MKTIVKLITVLALLAVTACSSVTTPHPDLHISWRFGTGGVAAQSLSPQSIGPIEDGTAWGWYSAERQAGAMAVYMLHVWQTDASGERTPVTGTWVLTDSSLGEMDDATDVERVIITPTKVGSTTLTVTHGALEETIDLIVYPGLAISTGNIHADPKPAFRLSDATYLDSSVGADLYIDASGNLIAPYGYVVSDGNLHNTTAIPDFSGAGTTLINYGETPVGDVIVRAQDGSYYALTTDGYISNGADSVTYSYGYKPLN